MDRGKKLGLSIFWVILTILLIIMIVMTVTVNYTFGSSLQSGTIFGKNIFVMNSDIMEPEINNGAAVIADKNEISVLTEGNVILFNEDSETENIMRIVEVVHNTDSTVYRAAGDNAQENVVNIPKENVIAKCEKTSDRIGKAVTFLRSITGIVACLLLPCILLLVMLLVKIFSVKKRKRLEEEEIVYPETFGIGSTPSEERDFSQNPLFDPSMAPKPDAMFEMKKSSIAEHFGVKPSARANNPQEPSERNLKTESAVAKFKAAVDERPSAPVTRKASLAPDLPVADKSDKMAAIKAALNEKDNTDAADNAPADNVQNVQPETQENFTPQEQPQPEVHEPPRKPKKEDNIKSIDDLIKALEEEKKKL